MSACRNVETSRERHHHHISSSHNRAIRIYLIFTTPTLPLMMFCREKTITETFKWKFQQQLKWREKRKGKTVNPNLLHKKKESFEGGWRDEHRDVKMFMLAWASASFPMHNEWMNGALKFKGGERKQKQQPNWDFCLSKKFQELPEKKLFTKLFLKLVGDAGSLLLENISNFSLGNCYLPTCWARLGIIQGVLWLEI